MAVVLDFEKPIVDIQNKIDELKKISEASGMDMDIRQELPTGFYKTDAPLQATCGTGDVLSRAKVRYQEIFASLDFIERNLKQLAGGKINTPVTNSLQKNAMAVSLTEAWRGELCQIVVTDEGGNIAQSRIVDPSFHNWFGLAMALRNEEISHFPICNKSFNLSYCGHDL